MSVYRNDTEAAGKIAEIKKEIKNYGKMEKGKKMRYVLKKTKYMMAKREKERKDRRKCKIRYSTENWNIPVLRNNMENGEGNLKQVNIITRKSNIIGRETDAIVAKNKVGKEEIRIKQKLFETCLMTALTWNKSMGKYKT